MNLLSLQQLNNDFNGALVTLLEAVVGGQRLCFYTKGCTFPAHGFEFWAENESNRYAEYAGETSNVDFYSMLGVAGLDYEMEIS